MGQLAATEKHLEERSEERESGAAFVSAVRTWTFIRCNFRRPESPPLCGSALLCPSPPAPQPVSRSALGARLTAPCDPVRRRLPAPAQTPVASADIVRIEDASVYCSLQAQLCPRSLESQQPRVNCSLWSRQLSSVLVCPRLSCRSLAGGASRRETQTARDSPDAAAGCGLLRLCGGSRGLCGFQHFQEVGRCAGCLSVGHTKSLSSRPHRPPRPLFCCSRLLRVDTVPVYQSKLIGSSSARKPRAPAKN